MSAYYVPIRKLVYLCVGNVPLPTPDIIILCYHSIGEGWDFSVPLPEFKKQINFLATKFHFLSLSDLKEFIEGKKAIEKPSVVITFDDGYQDIAQVKNFLKSKGIRSTVFVLADQKHANWQELGTRKQLLNTHDIKSLISAGWEIGCHSSTHPNLTKVGLPALRNEVIVSKQRLERSLGIKVKYFAYPKGNYSPEVCNAVRAANYSLALTMDEGIINTNTDNLKIPRIGVDGTHSFAEFKLLHHPLVSLFRGALKRYV